MLTMPPALFAACDSCRKKYFLRKDLPCNHEIVKPAIAQKIQNEAASLIERIPNPPTLPPIPPAPTLRPPPISMDTQEIRKKLVTSSGEIIASMGLGVDPEAEARRILPDKYVDKAVECIYQGIDIAEEADIAASRARGGSDDDDINAIAGGSSQFISSTGDDPKAIMAHEKQMWTQPPTIGVFATGPYMGYRKYAQFVYAAKHGKLEEYAKLLYTQTKRKIMKELRASGDELLKNLQERAVQSALASLSQMIQSGRPASVPLPTIAGIRIELGYKTFKKEFQLADVERLVEAYDTSGFVKPALRRFRGTSVVQALLARLLKPLQRRLNGPKTGMLYVGARIVVESSQTSTDSITSTTPRAETPSAGSTTKGPHLESGPTVFLPAARAVTIPDLVGREFTEAGDVLASLGLKASIVEKAFEETSDESQVGRVVIKSQDLDGGTVVPRGTRLRVRLKKMRMSEVEVPDVTGRNLDQVREILTGVGLDYRKEGWWGAKARVHDQSPRAGERARRGATVTVTFDEQGVVESVRRSNTVEVPNSIGMSAEQAANTGRAAGLRVRGLCGPDGRWGWCAQMGVRRGNTAVTVLEQDPSPGSQASRGDLLTVNCCYFNERSRVGR